MRFIYFYFWCLAHFALSSVEDPEISTVPHYVNATYLSCTLVLVGETLVIPLGTPQLMLFYVRHGAHKRKRICLQMAPRNSLFTCRHWREHCIFYMQSARMSVVGMELLKAQFK